MVSGFGPKQQRKGQSHREHDDQPARVTHQRGVRLHLQPADDDEDDQPGPSGPLRPIHYRPFRALEHDADIGAAVDSLK